MPTTLPVRPTRAGQRPFSYARLARLLAAFVYLLLLAWNVSALEADFSSLAAVDHSAAYNPMEPNR